MKKMMGLFSILLAFLFLGSVANAETDLLNLGSYNEGDTPSYGEDIIVEQDEDTGVKYITQHQNALDRSTMSFPINLSGDFEVFLKIESGYFSHVKGEDLFLISSDDYKIILSSPNTHIIAGNDANSLGESDALKSVNKIRLSVTNNIAKIYLNDIFDGKITLRADQSYGRLIMQGIQQGTKIYELTTSGVSNTSETSPSNISLAEEFEKGKQEGIQQCFDNPSSCGITVSNSGTPVSGDCMANYSLSGQLHVPCVSVPDAFGGTTVYDIKLNQQSGFFTFDLDMGSFKPR